MIETSNSTQSWFVQRGCILFFACYYIGIHSLTTFGENLYFFSDCRGKNIFFFAATLGSCTDFSTFLKDCLNCRKVKRKSGNTVRNISKALENFLQTFESILEKCRISAFWINNFGISELYSKWSISELSQLLYL